MRHPRNPLLGFVFAASFLLCAMLGFVALVVAVPTLGDIDSRRVMGFLVAAPFAFAAVGVVTAVRAVRAWAPWRRYRGATPLEQRRRDRAHDLTGQRLWPLIVFGALALAGQIAILVAAEPTVVARSLTGTLLFIEVNALLIIIWLTCAGLLVQCLLARRLRATRPLAETRNE